MYNAKEYSSDSFSRLSKILKNDKLHMPQMIEDCLKNDLLRAMSKYLQIKCCDLKICTNNDGKISFVFEGEAESYKAPQNT